MKGYQVLQVKPERSNPRHLKEIVRWGFRFGLVKAFDLGYRFGRAVDS
jgi:hypothetical protein